MKLTVWILKIRCMSIGASILIEEWILILRNGIAIRILLLELWEAYRRLTEGFSSIWVIAAL